MCAEELTWVTNRLKDIKEYESGCKIIDIQECQAQLQEHKTWLKEFLAARPNLS